MDCCRGRILLWIIVITISSNELTHGLKGQPRSLIFPPTAPTRVQFIGGVGIPVEDLNYESVTSGYVLKAEYFLPSLASELRPVYLKPQSIHRREFYHSANESYTLGSLNRYSQPLFLYRWIIYQGIETILNRSQLNGHICLLRTICEHAKLPLGVHSGLLAEILNTILSPASSKDDLTTTLSANYLKAEKIGHAGGNCAKHYKSCTANFIDQISFIFQ